MGIPSRALRFLLLVLGVSLLAPACKSDDPAAAVQAFLDALERKDGQAAYDRLSRASQRQVDAVIGEAQAQGKAPGGDPRTVAFQQVFSVGNTARRVLAVEVKQREDTRAVVKLTDQDYQTQEMRLVREDGQWKLSLEQP